MAFYARVGPRSTRASHLQADVGVHAVEVAPLVVVLGQAVVAARPRRRPCRLLDGALHMQKLQARFQASDFRPSIDHGAHVCHLLSCNSVFYSRSHQLVGANARARMHASAA